MSSVFKHFTCLLHYHLKLYGNQVRLRTYLSLTFNTSCRMMKNSLVEKIGEHRQPQRWHIKLTPESLFLFKMSGFSCCLLQFSRRGCEICVYEIWSVFSVWQPIKTMANKILLFLRQKRLLLISEI